MLVLSPKPLEKLTGTDRILKGIKDLVFENQTFCPKIKVFILGEGQISGFQFTFEEG